MGPLLVEQLVFKRGLDIQSTFAKEAAQLLDRGCPVQPRTTRKGLLLLAETEIPLLAAVQTLKARYGDVITASAPAVCSNVCGEGATPVMLVKVEVPIARCWMVRANLLFRGASIASIEEGQEQGFIRALAPLHGMLGFPDELSAMCDCGATVRMKFSHYRPLSTGPMPPFVA